MADRAANVSITSIDHAVKMSYTSGPSFDRRIWLWTSFLVKTVSFPIHRVLQVKLSCRQDTTFEKRSSTSFSRLITMNLVRYQPWYKTSLTVAWLKTNLKKRYYDSRRKTQKLPILAVGDLDSKKVEEIMNLKANQEDVELAYIPSIRTPTELKSPDESRYRPFQKST